MLINETQELSEVWKAVKYEIRRGAIDRKHPFRYTVMTTLLASRYVVLREADQELKIQIFTDARSAKVDQIKRHNFVQLLFYHPQKKTQVIFSGTCIIHQQNKLAMDRWKNIQGEATKSYSSIMAPGTVIDDLSNSYQWDENIGKNNFTVIEVIPESIEVLQLDTPRHIRARFARKDSWSGNWLVP